MIGAGLWLSTVLLIAVAGWIAATWGRPHRGGLVAMAGAAALATAVIAAIPRQRIVASRYREPFFLSWSLSLIVFIAVAAGLDDGVRSPIVLMLFLTLVVYAELSYPRWDELLCWATDAMAAAPRRRPTLRWQAPALGRGGAAAGAESHRRPPLGLSAGVATLA